MVSDDKVWQALQQVIDPELGINIVDLGLVYSVDVEDGHVSVAMTMTTPACPLNDYLTGQAEATIWQHVPEVQSVSINLVWDPPWHPGMISEAIQQQFGR